MKLMECCAAAVQCKSFRDKDVPLPRVYDILKTAAYAPEAAHADNLEFVVIRKKEAREQIAEQCPRQSWIAQAPCMVIIVNDEAKAKTLYGDRASIYCTQTAGAAAYSIALQAYELGLAACWIRAFNDKAVARIVQLPDKKTVEAIMLLGYPKEKQQRDNPISVDKITFFEKYGSKEAD